MGCEGLARPAVTIIADYTNNLCQINAMGDCPVA